MTLEAYLAKTHFSPSFQEFIRKDGETYRGVVIVPMRRDQWKFYQAFATRANGEKVNFVQSGFATKAQVKREIDFYQYKGWL